MQHADFGDASANRGQRFRHGSWPLDGFRFSRVFVLTFLGVFQWKVGEGWRKLAGEPEQLAKAAS